MKTPECKWREDSDTIFTQITSGDFPTFDMAQTAVCMLYVPAMGRTLREACDKYMARDAAIKGGPR